MIERYTFEEIFVKLQQNANAISFLLNNPEREDPLWLKALNNRIVEQVKIHRMLGLR